MRKKISLEQIEKEYAFKNYDEEAETVHQMIRQGDLVPLKSARLNGRYPSLPLVYWRIIEDEEDYQDELSKLHYLINPEYYMHHPKEYKKVREYVLKLNDYLNQQADGLQFVASRRERSYEIFGYEKVFDRHAHLLKHLGLTDDDLNMYETAEPIAYYHNGPIHHILAVENSSPYFTIRELMMQGQKTICGVPIDTIVYGGGKRLLSTFKELERSFAPNDIHDAVIDYVGDIDFEGLRILEMAHDAFHVRPFLPMYRAMVEKARNKQLYAMPPAQKKPNTAIRELFDEELYQAMMAILEKGYYIPQEILSMKDLREK